jgi:uncharacterized membrane protein YkoI
MNLDNITLAQYQSSVLEIGNGSIRIEENNGATVYQIPISQGNSDYQLIMEAVTAGTLTIADAE